MVWCFCFTLIILLFTKSCLVLLRICNVNLSECTSLQQRFFSVYNRSMVARCWQTHPAPIFLLFLCWFCSIVGCLPLKKTADLRLGFWLSVLVCFRLSGTASLLSFTKFWFGLLCWCYLSAGLLLVACTTLLVYISLIEYHRSI